MSCSHPVRTVDHRARPGLLVVAAAAAAALLLLGHGWWPGASSLSSLPTTPVRGTAPLHRAHGVVAGGHHARAGIADGVVPDGVTVLDERYPAVARLDPALLGALRRAATEAARDRVELEVNSGWRSPVYQDQLLDEAVAKYGSRAAAARWVATPTTSPHVSGDAVDVGPSEATTWLSRYGAAYGLCRIYGNEPWHFELRPGAVDRGCPRPYADPTHDPRMQR